MPLDDASAEAWFYRAATAGSVAAMNNLGLALAARGGTLANGEGATAWFQRAAEGGHQGAMYNLGHTLASSQGATSEALEAALPWFYAAAAAGSDTAVGKNAQAAAAQVEATLRRAEDGRRSGDGSDGSGSSSSNSDDRARLLPLSTDGLALWDAAASSYARFEARFQASQVVSDAGFADLRAAAARLEALATLLQPPPPPQQPTPPATAAAAVEELERSSRTPSSLWTPARADAVLAALQEVYAALARADDPEELAAAARANVARAQLATCRARFATTEGEPSCWNTAVSSAVTYFRRAGNVAAADAVVVELARRHPAAATQYPSSWQTPHVWAPGLAAQPWWDAAAFPLARALEASYRDGALQGDVANLVAAASAARPAAGRNNATTATTAAAVQLARVFHPAAPVAARDAGADAEGSGAWAELVLFDGAAWHSRHCALVPTLCRLLQASGVLCGQQQQDPQQDPPQQRPTPATAGSRRLALSECGTRVVATVFKLAPGARVQPHTGTTNRRLVLQFALAGSDGVRVRVGDAWRSYGGDGRAVVFDDSFEHEVVHGGQADRYVLYAALHHPGRLLWWNQTAGRSTSSGVANAAPACEAQERGPSAGAAAEVAAQTREAADDPKPPAPKRPWKKWWAALRTRRRDERTQQALWDKTKTERKRFGF
jgi:TPR repeat protein